MTTKTSSKFKRIADGGEQSGKDELAEWATGYNEGHNDYYNTILEHLENVSESGASILEVGSVPCKLTYLISKRNYNVIGLDINPNRVRSFIEQHNLDVRKCDIERENFPVSNRSFDVVLFTEVLEHLRMNPIKVFERIHQVLKPGGVLILSTPNQYHLGRIWDFIQGKGIQPNAYDEFMKLEEMGHMGHIREYAPQEVREFLIESRFSIKADYYYDFNDLREPNIVLGPVAHLVKKAIPWFRKIYVIHGIKPEDRK